MNMDGAWAGSTLIFAVCVLVACRRDVGGQERAAAGVVRRPSVAGGFYPGGAAELRKAVTAYLAAAPEAKPDGVVLAALAPHAGYPYSAPVAACAFKAMATAEFDTVVIIGHDAHVPGVVAFVSPDEAFATPLGEVAVDREMVKGLTEFHRGIVEDRRPHAREHTVEVQLPFLQASGRSFKVVPVLFGNPTVGNCRIFADAIAKAAGDRKVFVLASSDLSHYPTYEDAKRVDGRTLALLPSLDVAKLFEHLDKACAAGETEGLVTAMCARGGVGTAILFAAARGGDVAQVLKYANSGDVPAGDKGRVVGYGAALIVKSGRKP